MEATDRIAPEAVSWLDLEERALARLRADERQVLARAHALFPGRGRPRRGSVPVERVSVAERQAQYRARQRLLQEMALEAGYRTAADWALALVQHPANRGRVAEVPALRERRDLLAAVGEGRITAADLTDVAYDICRVAFERWELPPQGLPSAPAALATRGGHTTVFTPIGSLPEAALLPRGEHGLLAVQALDERSRPLPREAEPPDFEYLVRLEAGRLGCQLMLRCQEARSVVAVFPRVQEALAAARSIRAELSEPAPGIRFRIGLHRGRLVGELGGFPAADLHLLEAVLVGAESGQVLLTEAARGSLEPAHGDIEPCGPRILPILQVEPIFQLAGSGPALRPQASLGDLADRLPWLPVVAMPELVGEGVEAIRSGVRLVTYFGPGGSGASRVAFQAAAVLADAPIEAVHLLDLALVWDRGQLAKALAELLQVRTPGEDVIEPLIAHLRRRRVLLILESCDRALLECRELLQTLLPACPTLVAIATSTEPVGLEGERSIHLRPLLLPPASGGLTGLDDSEAGRLFLAALNRAGGRPVGAEEAAAVAEICRLLQGLPLAVETVAGAVVAEGLEPGVLLEDLTAYLEDETGVAAPALARSQLLHLAVSWRLHRLRRADPRLARSLLLLSVLPADFDARTAAAVLGIEVAAAAPILGELLRLGLVSPLPDRPASRAPVRYRINESVRLELAAARRHEEDLLPEAQRARERFVDHFAQLLGNALEDIHGADMGELLARLGRDLPHFRTALRWMRRPGKNRRWAAMAGAYARLLVQIGHTEEAERIAAEGLEEWAERDVTRLRLLAHAALIAWRLGDVERAERHWAAVVDLAAELGEVARQARGLEQMGMAALGRGDLVEAERRCRAALALARTARQREVEAYALLHLGVIAARRGDLAAARRRLRASVWVRRQVPRPDVLRIAESLLALAEVAVAEGDVATACAHLRSTLTTYWELGDRVGLASALCMSAVLAAAQGDSDLAVRLHAAARRVVEDMGQRIPAIWREVVERAVAGARARLPQRALEIAERRGSEMDGQRALEYARAHLAEMLQVRPRRPAA